MKYPILLALVLMSIPCSWACNFKNAIEFPEITGRLGFPLLTYHEVEGFLFLNYYGDQKPALIVTKMDEIDLEHPIMIAVEGIDADISSADFKFGGYEKSIFVGTPKDVQENSPSWKKKAASNDAPSALRQTETIDQTTLKDWFNEPQKAVWARQKKTISHGYYTSAFQVTDLIPKDH